MERLHVVVRETVAQERIRIFRWIRLKLDRSIKSRIAFVKRPGVLCRARRKIAVKGIRQRSCPAAANSTYVCARKDIGVTTMAVILDALRIGPVGLWFECFNVEGLRGP